MAKKILVIEDDSSIQKLVHYNLTSEHFDVDVASDGEEGFQKAVHGGFDLILLDIMLPKMDGYAILEALRDRGIHTPVLMLTARTMEFDKVTALNLGADDYITKPFSQRELLARINAVLRRTEQSVKVTKDEERNVLSFGPITVDLLKHTVSLDDTELFFSPKEFELLVIFLKNPGRVFTRDELLEKVWGYDFFGETRTVDVHIRKIREKIEEHPNKPTLIKTIHGVGYKLGE